MARLTRARRHALPRSAFVFPRTRKYPIHDRAHARAALGFAKMHGAYGRVAAAVRARYPSMAIGGRRRRSIRSRRRG